MVKGYGERSKEAARTFHPFTTPTGISIAIPTDWSDEHKLSEDDDGADRRGSVTDE